MAAQPRSPLTRNEKAAILALWAGILMLASGVTGASQWTRTFDLVEGALGANPLLRFVSLVFVAIGSVGGIFVILGAYAFREDRVRTGKLLILFGTGFTIVSLVVFLILQVRHGDAPFAGASLIGFAGIVLSIIARMRTAPTPLRR